MPIVETYYDAGAYEKGNLAAEVIAGNFQQDLQYYASQKSNLREYYDQEIQRAFAIIQQLSMQAKRYKQNETASKLDEMLNTELENF
jgi:flavin-dependent dehydrogenase